MGSLLVVSGPPGAGKSSVARLLADTADRSALIEGDAFFGFLARGAIEPWLPASQGQNTVVTQAAASAAGALATSGYTTVYDGVIGRGCCPRSWPQPASDTSTTCYSFRPSSAASSG